jgi:hypothetical protein
MSWQVLLATGLSPLQSESKPEEHDTERDWLPDPHIEVHADHEPVCQAQVSVA